MLKKLLISGFALLGGLAVANAGNVLVDTRAGDDPANAAAVTLADGTTLLPVGSGYVAAGTFTIPDAEISAATSGAALLAGFKQFGSAGNIPEFAGLITHDASMPLADGDGFVGNPIYAVVGNNADLGSSTQALVYKSENTFAADNPLFESSAPIWSANSTTLLLGTSGGKVLQPDFGAEINAVGLAVVPEPSSALLALVGGLLFFRRRR